MANRLADAQSVYLRQHASNPVDWWPWSAEAFAEARRRDVPVMLSVGYASCHWCHVMARESFADPETAAQLNAGFVPIKVDREERPDVDAVYMSATQALTGQGGWPMTCFLTPEGEPFYAGTYFPPTPVPGLPSFRQLLTAVGHAWSGDQDQVRASAGRIAESLASLTAPLTPGRLSEADLAGIVEGVLRQVDPDNGGFGGAPKFPPALIIEFLLRHHERTGSMPPLQAVDLTLEQMARGGIYDQLAGGFARYSVDATWHVPHFEKMLDDNALLLRLYAHHARRTGSELSARVARETAEFLLRELRLPGGGFAASLDADTGGVEGATYRWTWPELVAVLGEPDAHRAAQVFALPGPEHAAAVPNPPGHGSRGGDDLAAEVLRLPADPADPQSFDDVRARLLRHRNRRPQPARDDIVVLRSNGQVIAALAEAGAAAGRRDWVQQATECVEYLTATHLVDGRWRRSSMDGRPGPGPAVLADHGDLAAGLLSLYQATGDPRWLRQAGEVLELAVRHFSDADDAGFFDTADDAGGLIVRPRDLTDGAAPSGQSSITHALLTAAALTGDAGDRARAEAALATVAELVTRYPRSAGWHLCAAELVAQGPLQVAVVGPAGAELDAMAALVRRHTPAGAVIDIGSIDPGGVAVGRSSIGSSSAAANGGAVSGGDVAGRALLADRPAIDGRPTVYVCRGFVCDLPATEPDHVMRRLTVGAGTG